MESVLVINSALLWVIVALNLLLTFALVRRVNISSGNTDVRFVGSGLEAGERAPDFVAESLSGETVTLATYARRAVAFLFVGTHCPPCRESLPRYQSLYPLAAQANIDLVLVSVDSVEQTQALVDEFGVSMPVIVAPQRSNSFLSDYKATGTPSYCLINAEGIVQSAGHPSFDWGEWKGLAESWKAEQPINS